MQPDVATLLANTIKNNQNNPLYGNSPIPSNQIQPTSSVNLGIPKQDTTNYAGITGGVSDSLANEFMSVNEERNRQQEITNQAGQDQLDIMKILSGKTADTQIANESAGVNAESANLTKYAEQLAGLNAQAMTLNREAQAVPLLVQENNRNTGATDRGVAPQEAGALRLNALKALSIAQQSDIAAAAATGSQLRLQAAKDKAQQIVDLKYKPLEDALVIKKQQYELNKDLLSSIDKKRTEALNIALKREEQAIADKKDTEKSIQTIALDARKNGAPDEIIQAITNSKNYEEAIIAIGKYMRDPMDVQLKQAQIDSANRANRPSGDGAPVIKTINGVDMQWNGKEWVNPTGGVGAGDTSDKTLSQFQFIRDSAKEADRLAGASGWGSAKRFVADVISGDNKSNQLEAYVNTLKTNMLTLATDPNIKKFFGPQMSNADVQLMVSAGTTLNPKNQTPAQLRAEIKRIDDFVNRAQTAVRNGQTQQQTQGQPITAPDGTQIIIVD